MLKIADNQEMHNISMGNNSEVITPILPKAGSEYSLQSYCPLNMLKTEFLPIGLKWRKHYPGHRNLLFVGI